MRRPIVEKGPEGVLTLKCRYLPPDLRVGETITNVESSVLPVGLTLVGAPQVSGVYVTQVVSGGVAKTDYLVRFKVTTSAGQVYEHPNIDSVLVKVV